MPRGYEVGLDSTPIIETLLIKGIEDQVSTISILSIEGKVIKQLTGTGIGQISVSGISSGVYIFQLSNSKIKIAKQILIK